MKSFLTLAILSATLSGPPRRIESRPAIWPRIIPARLILA
jgi:hypothetical protein